MSLYDFLGNRVIDIGRGTVGIRAGGNTVFSAASGGVQLSDPTGNNVVMEISDDQFSISTPWDGAPLIYIDESTFDLYSPEGGTAISILNRQLYGSDGGLSLAFGQRTLVNESGVVVANWANDNNGPALIYADGTSDRSVEWTTGRLNSTNNSTSVDYKLKRLYGSGPDPVLNWSGPVVVMDGFGITNVQATNISGVLPEQGAEAMARVYTTYSSNGVSVNFDQFLASYINVNVGNARIQVQKSGTYHCTIHTVFGIAASSSGVISWEWVTGNTFQGVTNSFSGIAGTVGQTTLVNPTGSTISNRVSDTFLIYLTNGQFLSVIYSYPTNVISPSTANPYSKIEIFQVSTNRMFDFVD